MAIFASRYERKLPLDDTEALSCEIATVEEVNGHTVSAAAAQEVCTCCMLKIYYSPHTKEKNQ